MSVKSEETRKLARMGVWATRILLVIAAVIVVLEFSMHRHGKIAVEDWPLFPAAFAILICIFIVVSGVCLRSVVMRSEDYYDEDHRNDE